MKKMWLGMTFAVVVGATGWAQNVTVTAATAPPGLVPLATRSVGRVLVETDARNSVFGGKIFVSQWPGTYFTAAFTGDTVYLRIGDGKQILHVSVDGQAPVVLSEPAAATYRVSGLRDGLHEIRVETVTEAQAGPRSFAGFAVPKGKAGMVARPVRRQMEFIGDSHTVGYGNTSASRRCSAEEIFTRTDTSQAFGALTAKHFAADYQVNAISGRGVVRNYNGSAGDPLPVAYPYVLFDKQNVYVDPAWQPQVVVVALGTNDFSTALNAAEPWKTRESLHVAYEKAYVAFLEQLRTRDPNAFFILWATGLADGEIEAEGQKVVTQMQAAGERRVAYLPVDGLGFTACDSHPSAADDTVIASKLMDFIDRHAEVWAEGGKR